MRIAYAALATLLTVTAFPSTGSCQVLTLHDYGNPLRHAHNLDRAVPVATVSLVDDIVALDGARVVQDPYGQPFVLGAATLDRHDPSRLKIVFTMTNRTDTVIPLKDVLIYERTMIAATSLRGVTVGAPVMPTSAAGWGPGDLEGEELQPGASLTVEVPLSPFDTASVYPSGFIVFVGRKVPHTDRGMDPTGAAWIGDNRPAYTDPSMPAGRAWLGENPIFTRAFLALVSQGQSTGSRF